MYFYRAMEEERTSNAGLYERNELTPVDDERLSKICKQPSLTYCPKKVR